MDTCTVEVGLLRKKPCGHASVTHCATCEQPLCKDHAIPQLVGGKKTGKFMCKECDVAHREFEKTAASAAKDATGTLAKAAEAHKPAAAAAPTPAAKAAAKPAAPAATKTAAPAAGKPAAPAAKPAEQKKVDDDAPLEFTPSKPAAPKK